MFGWVAAAGRSGSEAPSSHTVLVVGAARKDGVEQVSLHPGCWG